MSYPFKQYGTEYDLYPLNKDYTINENYILSHIKDNSIILISNYLGLKTEEATNNENKFIDNLKKNYNIIIIRDCTQQLSEALYSDKTKSH